MPRLTEQIGESWWSRRWLGALANFGDGYASRMARGRNYALNGRVWQADVRPGVVTARVHGSFVVPYLVELHIAPLAEATWDHVIATLASQAAYTIKLQNGEMPADIEAIFAQAGGHLFPQHPDEIEATCTCLDWSRPCKHVAAVHYMLATNLDMQPTLLFTLRGRTNAQVLSALRARWSADMTGAAATGEDDDAPQGQAHSQGHTPLRVERFYQAGAELDDFQISGAPPQVEGALLKRLGKPPFAAEQEDPLPALLRAYSAVTARALQAQSRGAGGVAPARRKGKR